MIKMDLLLDPAMPLVLRYRGFKGLNPAIPLVLRYHGFKGLDPAILLVLRYRGFKGLDTDIPLVIWYHGFKGFSNQIWTPFLKKLTTPVRYDPILNMLNLSLLLTDFVCLYNYEFGLSLCKIVRSSVILLLPLFTFLYLCTA